MSPAAAAALSASAAAPSASPAALATYRNNTNMMIFVEKGPPFEEGASLDTHMILNII